MPQEVRDLLAARGYTVHARSGRTPEFGGAQAGSAAMSSIQAATWSRVTGSGGKNSPTG